MCTAVLLFRCVSASIPSLSLFLYPSLCLTSHTHTNTYTHISGDLVTMASQRRLTANFSGARNLPHRWYATGEYVSLTPLKLDPFEPIASNLPFSSPNNCQSRVAHLFTLKTAYLLNISSFEFSSSVCILWSTRNFPTTSCY